MKSVTLLVLGLVVFMSSCVPAHLAKYRKNSSGSSSNPDSMASPQEPADTGLAGPGIEMNRDYAEPRMPAPTSYNTESRSRRSANAEPPQRATIYAVDQQTFRFMIREEEVWDGALQVLMKNYNVNIVDKSSGIITTEWDTFYLNNTVYRNKVSMRVRRVSKDSVDVTIHNGVERLQDGSAAGAIGAVWLPGEDPANEVGRLVQNMALSLNQPPPILPPSMVAKSVEEKDVLDR